MRISTPQSKKFVHSAGFTLVELLVVIVIMSLITLVFLNRQSKFDSATIMRSLAYSVALSVRQAQVYGVSVRPTATGAANFSAAHGLHFSSATPSSYIIFADQKDSAGNRDNAYTAAQDTVDQTFTLGGGYRITELCAVNSLGRRCTGANDSSGPPGSISSLVILFVRPNPDAQIFAYKNDGTPLLVGGVPETYSSAYVQISSVNGDTRFIAITNTGQVSVCGLGAALGSSGC